MSKNQIQAPDPLKTVTARISSTPTSHLPHVIQHIARSLLDCRAILSLPESQRPKGSAEALSVHKFKTQLQALANDKSPAGRYAAVVLIKTAVDVGGHEQLQGSLPWVRGLLAMLSRSTDPPASKRLAIICLTRIFLLTKDYQTLVRELTTPCLPAFITSCLNIVAPKDPPTRPLQALGQKTLLEPVLESFGHLVPNHPNIFRTFLSQINDLIAPLIAPTPSCLQREVETRQSSRQAAQTLFTLLPGCAPKQANSNSNTTTTTTTTATPDAWTTAVRSTIDAIHATADALFRAVHEDWRSVAGVVAQPNAPQSYEGDLASADAAYLAIPQIRASGLPGWSGVHAGGERLVGLLQLLQAFLQGQTSTTVELPVGRIVDVLGRIMSTTAPLPPRLRTKRNAHDQMRINPAIGQDERMGLWAELPQIHAAAADTVTILLLRLGTAALPVLEILLEHVLWVFGQESETTILREALYGALTEMVELAGTSFTKERTRALDSVVKAACGDLLPEQKEVTKNEKQQVNGKAGNASKQGTTGTINADALFKAAGHVDQPDPSRAAANTSLQDAAHDFTVTYTNTVPSRYMSAATRALIDRTAILSNDAEAMIASVMNPPHNESSATKSRSSILPFLARAYPKRIEVEALLRPRMPAVHMSQQDDGDDMDEDDESNDAGDDEDAEEDEDGDEQMQDDAQMAAPIADAQPAVMNKPPMDPLLEQMQAEQDQKATVQIENRQGENVSLLGKRSGSGPASEGQSKCKRPKVQQQEANPVPIVVPDSRDPSQGSHVAVVESSAPVFASNAAQDSDDDDNFVMPTLTLEQDTDDEDEDAD